MRLTGSHQLGKERLLVLALALLVIGFSFAGRGRPSVVSTWVGDAGSKPADAAAPSPPLRALFAKSAAAPAASRLAELPHDPVIPWGNPTDSAAAVMTQGYGVGTHAPAAVWGGIDLAIDGNGDGEADPQGSDGAPIFATHSGVVKVTANSVPAGNHVWVSNEHYKTGYGHLKSFAVESGQVVERGTLLGYMGASGQATGPHLHYDVWKDGVNVNPLEYAALP